MLPTVAGVSGVVMTLSLILMLSSATELIRYTLDNHYILIAGWQAGVKICHAY